MKQTCPKCGHLNPSATGEPLDTCPACGLIYARFDAALALRQRIDRARNTGNWDGIAREHIPEADRPRAAARLLVTTTPMVPNFIISEVVDVISAEVAFGMNLVRDMFAGITDVVGGRSNATQSVLRGARKKAIAELRAEAFELDADAVVGVQLVFSEFSGGGKSMLFAVATGTAVKLAPVG